MVFALALATSICARNVTEDHTRKSFTVSDGGKLIIDADRGSIEVKTGANATVDIEVIRTVKRGGEKEAKELLSRHLVTLNQEGNTISVKGELPGKWFSKRRGPNLEVRYIVRTPQKFNTDLRTSGGDVSVGDLDGEGRYRTSGGNIKLSKSAGPVFARSSGRHLAILRWQVAKNRLMSKHPAAAFGSQISMET